LHVELKLWEKTKKRKEKGCALKPYYAIVVISKQNSLPGDLDERAKQVVA